MTMCLLITKNCNVMAILAFISIRLLEVDVDGTATIGLILFRIGLELSSYCCDARKLCQKLKTRSVSMYTITPSSTSE